MAPITPPMHAFRLNELTFEAFVTRNKKNDAIGLLVITGVQFFDHINAV